MAKIRTSRSNWHEIVLVCRKCSKKVHGGFGSGGRKSLGKTLRRHLGLAKGRRSEIGFIEVGCFDVCPKKAVTVALGSAPDRRLIIPAGLPLEEIVVALNLARHVDKTSGETPPAPPAER